MTSAIVEPFSPSEADPQTPSAGLHPVPIANKRLYVNNVSYQTTEQDIYDLLKDFEVLSVLVPSQTVRGFKSNYQRSLGIAYIDFVSEQEAEQARFELNGKLLYERALRVRNFVPYSPSGNIKRSNSKSGSHHHFLRRSNKSRNIDGKAAEETIIEEHQRVNGDDEEGINGNDENSGVIQESSTPIEDSERPSFVALSSGNSNLQADSIVPTDSVIGKAKGTGQRKQEPVSEDTVFISRLHPKVTDGDLREFFHEYSPTDVYIFKSRSKRSERQFSFSSQRHVSALVTLSTENGLADALVNLSDRKVRNKKVGLKAAFLSKIEEVKRAADARQQKLKEDQLDISTAASDNNKEEARNQDVVSGEGAEGDDSLNIVQEEDKELGFGGPEQAYEEYDNGRELA